MRLALAMTFVVPDEPERAAPSRVLDRLRRTEARAVALSSNLPPGLLEELCKALGARRDELPVLSVENVCPAQPAQRADLASLDRAEAQVAMDAAIATVRRAGKVGATHVALRLGDAQALRDGWPRARQLFLRGQLDEETRHRGRLLKGRTQAGARHLDVALRVLDRLARVAEGEGVVIGLRNPGPYLALPWPEELSVLLEELAGAPVRPCLDVAAAHLADAMGTISMASTLAAYGASPVAYVSDACGAAWGLPPGHGEVDLGAVLSRLPEDATIVYRLAPGLDDVQLDAAISGALALTERCTQEARARATAAAEALARAVAAARR